MQVSASHFLRLCFATVAFLSVPAFGSTCKPELLLTCSAETLSELFHDSGRLVLSFSIITFVIVHLCTSMYCKFISRRRSTTDRIILNTFTADQADTDEDDPLDLILQALVYSLQGVSSLLCTALAACRQGVSHGFAFTMRGFATGSTPLSSAFVIPPYPPPSSSSAAIPPTKPPPLSSSVIASSLEPGLADLRATRSSSSSDTGRLDAVATLTHHNSCLTKQNCWLSRHLEGVKSSNTRLQQQLQEAHAALLTSRSNAESAGALAAQASAEKQRRKAALREMEACVEEMYMEGELAFERILNEKETFEEQFQQERASRVQEVQTLMEQVSSLTSQLALSQDEVADEQQKSNKLAKCNTQLKQERDVAKRSAMAISACLRKVIISQAAAGHEEVRRKREAACACKKAPVRPDTCRASQTRSHISAAAPANKHNDASSGPNSSKPSVLGGPIKAGISVTREPLNVIGDRQLTVQAAETKIMPALSKPASTASSHRQACCAPSDKQHAQENVAPAAGDFTFGFRHLASPDSAKPIFAACASSLMEARTRTIKAQRLSPTTVSEAHSHVNSQVPSKAERDSKFSKVALDESSPTAIEAGFIHVAGSTVPTTTALSSNASTRDPPTSAIEASNKHAIKICTSITVNANNEKVHASSHIPVNMAATTQDVTKLHVPTLDNTQMSSTAATRLDEASLSLLTLDDRYGDRYGDRYRERYRDDGHSGVQKKVH